MKRIFLALFVLSIALIGVSCVSAASDVDIAHDHSNCGDFGVFLTIVILLDQVIQQTIHFGLMDLFVQV